VPQFGQIVISFRPIHGRKTRKINPIPHVTADSTVIAKHDCACVLPSPFLRWIG
jgi:hypothetical protein